MRGGGLRCTHAMRIAEPWAVQIEAKAKWNAWTANKGLSKDAAKEKYIAKATELAANYK